VSIVRALKILLKDLRLGPRSPIFIWALVYPVVITLAVQGVFGSLFEPRPRLGIVDRGGSGITTLMSSSEGIDVTLLKTVSDLKRRVERNDLDAGLVLKAGFDTAMRSGQKPLLEFYIGGESLASNRIILAVTTLEALRRVNGNAPPVQVEINTLGDGEALSMSTRLVPMMVLFALLIAGVFVPAFGLVEERENRTLGAVLVTPVRLSEVLAAKAVLGIILAVLMAYITLLLNGALGPRPAALIMALVVAGVMSAEFGLIYGTVARDVKTLFTLMKTLNVFLLAPVIFYIFPDWPQWIAKVFPTYWLINPIFEITVKGAALNDVASELGVAVGLCMFLAVTVRVLKRRMQTTLSAG